MKYLFLSLLLTISAFADFGLGSPNKIGNKRQYREFVKVLKDNKKLKSIHCKDSPDGPYKKRLLQNKDSHDFYNAFDLYYGNFDNFKTWNLQKDVISVINPKRSSSDVLVIEDYENFDLNNIGKFKYMYSRLEIFFKIGDVPEHFEALSHVATTDSEGNTTSLDKYLELYCKLNGEGSDW